MSDNIPHGSRAISALNQRLRLSEFCNAHGITTRTIAGYAEMHIIAIADQRIPVCAKRGFLSTGPDMERNAKGILVAAINMRRQHEYMCTTDAIASSLAHEIRIQLENKARNRSFLARCLSGTCSETFHYSSSFETKRMPGAEHVEVTGTGELSCVTPWLGNEATLRLNITLRIRSVRVDLVQIAAELGLPATRLLRELQWRAEPADDVDRVDDVSEDEEEEEEEQDDPADGESDDDSEKVTILRSVRKKPDEDTSASTAPTSKKRAPEPKEMDQEQVHVVENVAMEAEPSSKKMCSNNNNDAKDSATPSSTDAPVTVSVPQLATPPSASLQPPIAASTTPGSGRWSSLWSSKRD